MIIGLAAGVPEGRQQPEFRAAANTVSVRATVVDAAGRIVPDLTRADFEVYDNGRLQPLTVFDAGQRPISIVVMVDRSSSMHPHASRVEAAARAFVANLMPGDRARLGSFADEIRIEPDTFTADQAALYGIIERSPDPAGATPLWLATAMALDALAAEDGPRVVLVFTDGRDTPAFSENVTFLDILSRVRREDAIVYAVGLAYTCGPSAPAKRTPSGWWDQGGRPGPMQGPRVPFPRPPIQIPFPGGGWPRQPQPPLPRRPPVDSCRESGPDPDLRQLAVAGGGGYFELRSTDNLTSAFERVARELHSQYLLGFAPPEFDGALYSLDVRVRRAGMTVRARRTYLAAAE
jgi:VWFA-related protein